MVSGRREAKQNGEWKKWGWAEWGMEHEMPESELQDPLWQWIQKYTIKDIETISGFQVFKTNFTTDLGPNHQSHQCITDDITI